MTTYTDAIEQAILRARDRQERLRDNLTHLQSATDKLLDDDLALLQARQELRQRRTELLAGADTTSPLLAGRNESIRAAELDTLTAGEISATNAAERRILTTRAAFEYAEAGLSVARHQAALECAILGAIASLTPGAKP